MIEWRIYLRNTTVQLLTETRCSRSRTRIRDSSEVGSSSCQCTTTLTGAKSTMKTYAGKFHRAYPLLLHYFRPGAGHFSALEIRVGPSRANRRESGTTLPQIWCATTLTGAKSTMKMCANNFDLRGILCQITCGKTINCLRTTRRIRMVWKPLLRSRWRNGTPLQKM